MVGKQKKGGENKMRKRNIMVCDECGKVKDFKDKYKPDTLFHRCDDGKEHTKFGIWRKKNEVK